MSWRAIALAVLLGLALLVASGAFFVLLYTSRPELGLQSRLQNKPQTDPLQRDTRIPDTRALNTQIPDTQIPSTSGPFTAAEVAAFSDAAEKAEALTDPLQRCLTYPDPPGSHWLPKAVEAYCRYLTQKIISSSEVKDLVDSGRTAELDRRLADALQAQRTDPGSRGLLDATYFEDFKNASADLRATLDAWKRQSPDSAFAYAASGVAYGAQAREVRGTDVVANTPASHLDAMVGLLKLSVADLGMAEKLDPHLTPIYAAMIEAGGLAGDDAYAQGGIDRGLEVDPTNYWIYSRRLWWSKPNWNGSLEEMRNVIGQAQTHATDNPLLLMLLPEADAAENNVECSCRTPEQVAAFRQVFDQAAASKLLASAGVAADHGQQKAMAMIYLSEALRFDPGLIDERVFRVNELVDLHQPSWALAEANRLIALAPKNKFSYGARAYYYRSASDSEHAEQDLLTALQLAPDDAWTLDEIGELYVNRTSQWDKGWDIANRLIQSHPDDYHGWVLRASIQKDQPRPGLHETLAYFVEHFGNDPEAQSVMPPMRAELDRENSAGHP